MAKFSKDEKFVDALLRPGAWDEYIGQTKIKNSLEVMIGAATKRQEAVDHLLFYGAPGLGKTTLASLVAKKAGANFKTISAPNLSRRGDLIAILSNLENGDVLFIDEAHRLHPAMEEIFYSALDARKIDFLLGKGPASRMISLDLPAFTLIAATTRVNLISFPLRSRFGAVFQLDYYERADIQSIISRSAEILKIKINTEAIQMIVAASRFTPRLANRLLKRCRDIADVKNYPIVAPEIVQESFNLFGIDAMGLENHDRRLLKIIKEKFRGGPVGLNTLAAVIGEEKSVIEEIYEPYLMKIGLLQRTPRGRVITEEYVKNYASS